MIRRLARFALPFAILAALVGLLIYAASTPRSAAIVIPAGTAPQLAEPDRLRLSGAPEPGSHGNGAPAPAAPPPTPKEEVGVMVGLAASDAPSARPTPSPRPRPSAGPPAPRASLAGGRIGPRSPAATRPAKVPRPAASVAPAAGSCNSPCTVDVGTKTLTGAASYWNSFGSGFYAAMGGYRDGDRVVALVNSFHDGRTYSVTVVVSTQCGACRWAPGATLIDLSADAFRALGWPLSRGIAPVTVTLLEGSI